MMETLISLVVGTMLTFALVGLTLTYGILGFSGGMFLFLFAAMVAK